MTPTDITERSRAFRALHHQDRAFIIPNPFDRGTAILLANLGFQALATTSAGFAFSRGRPDNQIDRDDMLAHAADLVAATALPVSADLEDGYGDTLVAVAETYRLAAATGLAGASIEDDSGDPDRRIYEIGFAIDRVRAASDAVHGLSPQFALTARCENYLVGAPDLADTITRLQAYQEAGADVLYAPGLRTAEEIGTVVRSVDRPVNVLMGLQGVRLSLDELSALGVKRVSVGSALSRAALGAVTTAARSMLAQGTFGFADDAISYGELQQIFAATPKGRSTPRPP